MRGRGLLRKAAMWFLIVAVAFFAVAAGVFVRDFSGASAGNRNVSLDPFGSLEVLFYAYELTYDLAVFSTVEVRTVVESSWGEWRVEFQSNGSLVTSFRPELPGVHQATITSLESRTGQLGVSILQLSDLPPELETSVLDPLLYLTAGLLAASVISYFFGRPRESHAQ